MTAPETANEAYPPAYMRPTSSSSAKMTRGAAVRTAGTHRGVNIVRAQRSCWRPGGNTLERFPKPPSLEHILSYGDDATVKRHIVSMGDAEAFLRIEAMLPMPPEVRAVGCTCVCVDLVAAKPSRRRSEHSRCNACLREALVSTIAYSLTLALWVGVSYAARSAPAGGRRGARQVAKRSTPATARSAAAQQVHMLTVVTSVWRSPWLWPFERRSTRCAQGA